MINDRLPIIIGPGIVDDDTSTKIGAGAWIEGDKVRFRDGQFQSIGGWESITTNAVTGKARGGFNWRNNDGTLCTAIGTHTGLWVIVGGDLYDITPVSGFTAGNADGYGGAGYGTGAYSVGIYSRPSDGAFFPLTWSFGTIGDALIACPRGQGIFIWTGDTSAPAVKLADDVTIHDAAFSGYADQTAFDVDWTRGTGWTFDATNDEADCDGSQSAVSNLTRTVTTEVLKAYDVTITFRNRSAGTIRAYGNAEVGVTSSAASGTVTVTFVASSTSSAVGAQGDADFIGSIADMTVVERGAPASVQYIECTPEGQVIAYGCNERVSNVVNLRCIRWSGLAQAADESVYQWQKTAANNAGQYVLEGGGRLVCAKPAGFGSFVLSDSELYYRTYRGDPEKTFDWTPLGQNCGVCGPNAAAVLGQDLVWMSPAFKFWMAPPGGGPVALFSPLARDLADNIAPVQADKVYASSLTEFGEVLFSYPDKRDGNENSRCIVFERGETGRLGRPVWTKWRLARTMFMDASPGPFPIGVSPEGSIYWHERLFSADGGALEWSIETGDIRIAEGASVVVLSRFLVDLEDQVGGCFVTFYSKMKPRGAERTHGPYTITTATEVLDLLTSDPALPPPCGAYLRMKISASSAPSFVRMGECSVEPKIRGRR